MTNEQKKAFQQMGRAFSVVQPPKKPGAGLETESQADKKPTLAAADATAVVPAVPYLDAAALTCVEGGALDAVAASAVTGNRLEDTMSDATPLEASKGRHRTTRPGSAVGLHRGDTHRFPVQK